MRGRSLSICIGFYTHTLPFSRSLFSSLLLGRLHGAEAFVAPVFAVPVRDEKRSLRTTLLQAADGRAMSRSNSPQQFILDEVSSRDRVIAAAAIRSPRRFTAGPHPTHLLQETRFSTSSHTDSLLGIPEATLNGDANAYPPRPLSDDEKRPTTDESDQDGQALLSGDHARARQVKREPIRVPTKEDVDGIKQNPRSRPRHVKTVLLGLVCLLGTAWLATWVSSLGISSGGQIQVVLMISDGMGELPHDPHTGHAVREGHLRL